VGAQVWEAERAMADVEGSLNIRVLKLGEMTVVGLEGDLRADAAPLLDEHVRDALDRDSTIIVLDCSLLRSLGRDEVALLAQEADAVHARHGRFIVRQPSDAARALLAEGGLLDRIEIEN
jgi:anti-anti-sigma factor